MDRVLSVANMLVAAILLHLLIGAFDALDARSRGPSSSPRSPTTCTRRSPRST
jgi:hypothetical protein